MTTPPRYAAIYARVSTEDQGKNFSIPTQLEACQQVAARDGYLVPESHVLVDEGITGTTLDRPALRQLRTLVQTQAITAALVYDPDRLSRTLGHQLLLSEEMERAGVTLLIVSHPLEQGPEGWLFFQMRGAIAEYERAKILERLTRGQLGRAKAGQVNGGNVPLGYRYVAGEKTGRFEIDEEEALLVRRIFALYLQGLSIRGIAMQLTAERVPTQRDRRQANDRKRLPCGTWNVSTLQQMLCNETYVGRWYYNKRQSLPGKQRPDKHTRYQPRDRAEWILVPIPALIDEATFQAVQAQRARNAALARRRRKYAYLFLGGRLRCGQCGGAMSGTTKRPGRRVYRCARRRWQVAPVQPCHGSVKADTLEAQVWAAIEAFLRHPTRVAAMVAQQQASADEQRAEVARDLAPVDAALAKCDVEDRRLVDAYTAGAFTPQELKGYRAEITTRRQSLLAQQAQLQAKLAGLGQAEGQVKALTDYCARVRQRLRTFDDAEKQVAMEALEIRVLWRPGVPPQIQGRLDLEGTASTGLQSDSWPPG